MTTATRESMSLLTRIVPVAPPSLESLPDELLQLVLSFLPGSDLKHLALVSKCLCSHAIEPLWRKVNLTDTYKVYLNDVTQTLWGERGRGESDEHDDTPIIRKLFILAKNPFIASKVQILTHSCHLPTPGIFSELPYIYFDSPHISTGACMSALIQLAIRNLINVHTLRVICGHKSITHDILQGFLNPGRPRRIPLRKLWLESCSLLGANIDFGSLPAGLESIRIRRLRAEVGPRECDRNRINFPEFRMARWGHLAPLHDGSGGFMHLPVELGHSDIPHPRINSNQMDEKAEGFDRQIWDNHRDIVEFIVDNRDSLPLRLLPGRKAQPGLPAVAPDLPLLCLLASSPTITKLNLDWILWRRHNHNDVDEPALTILHTLSRSRFPNLRAFQIRNAVVSMTKLPSSIFLLESTFLDFLEAHPKIQCLAFPLDRFYSDEKQSQEIMTRSRKLVAHFGMVLVDLRLDCCYNNHGDPVTDEGSGGVLKTQERHRRRRFIEEFAPYMKRIENIKMEGGIPRDEKREILRALHFCPLKKIVMIGASFPVGNTWGFKGEDLKVVDPGVGDQTYELEEEDQDALIASYGSTPSVAEPFEYKPSYRWPPLPNPAFLHDIAAHHADTIVELKLCGFNGSPVLSHFLPVTRPLLYPLVHFHNLRQLIISMWLSTFFEDDYRDAEIIQSWKDTRPNSTALVVVTPSASPPSSSSNMVAPTVAPDTPNPAARPQEFNRWAVVLKTRFTPSALAYRVAADLGPFLSPVAKNRNGGVRVRASFCLGYRDEDKAANDIFDLDIRIGRHNQVLEFVGPREEGEKGRWWDKLEGRSWF